MEPTLSGGLIVDKPRGLTSHDVVAAARRLPGAARVGHTGTLDPLATGVLVLVLGRATRVAQFLVADEKEYVASIRLGRVTATYDAEGIDGEPPPPPGVTDDAIDAALKEFRGSILQTPPAFSAKKVDGRRAYERARKQQPVALAPVPVTVSDLVRLPASDAGSVRVRLVAGSGFYVRSFAHDLGQRLGCGAYLEDLRRTRVGRFGLRDAVPFESLGGSSAPPMIDLNGLLEHIPSVTLTAAGAARAGHGNAVSPADMAEAVIEPHVWQGPVRLVGPDGALVAVASRRADTLLHPHVVLV